MHKGRSRPALALFLAVPLLGACQGEQAPTEKAVQAVRTEIVDLAPFSPTITLTGTVAARVESDLSFRFAGQIAARSVDVGDHVVKGQVLATIETEEQEADVTSTAATLSAAEASLRQAQTNFARQRQLLAGGYTTKSIFDTAQEALTAAEGDVASAKADLASARDQLAYTDLKADADGIVTARNAEAGQVVDAAQTVFTVARDGERDAVFDVYEAVFANEIGDETIDVALVSNPSVHAVGVIREISPTFDAASGTVRVKVSLRAPPAAMTLGTAVSGTGRVKPYDAVVLPWTAFSATNGRSAVWVVDPRTKTVSLREIRVDRYRTGAIVVREGLSAGEIVVTAGGQLLRNGQTVVAVEEARP